MPGIKELTAFRNELAKLGNEPAITEERGEVYDPLPMPTEVSLGDSGINVDDLLSSIDNSDLPPEVQDVLSPVDDTQPDMSAFESLLDDLPLEPLPESAGTDDGSDAFELSGQGSGGDDLAFDLPDLGGSDLELPEAVDKLSDAEELSDAEIAGEPPAFDLPDPGGTDFDLPETGEAAGDLPDADGADEFELPESAADAEELADTGLDGGDAAFNLPDLGDSFSMPDFGGDSGFSMPTESAGADEDSFAVPSDLLSGFGDEILSERENAGGVESSGFDPGAFSFDSVDEPESLDSLIPDDAGAVSDISDIPDIPDISDVMSTFMGQNEDLPDMGSSGFGEVADFTIPGMEDAESGFGAPPPAASNVDTLPSSGIPSSPFGDDFADFSVPDDLPVSEPEAVESSEPDGFDGFSLDDDFLKGSGEDDDFHIPGFSDFTSDSGKKNFAEFAAGFGKSGKKEVPLTISDDDFRFFLNTVASYPLNLRLAIEEFIAGEDGSEHQKMDLVHKIVTKTPIRKVASVVSSLIDRHIEIPHDYEKRNAVDWEKEKSSLKYVFFNRILPAAIIFTIVALLTASTLFLSYQFIYRPLDAQRLYRKGYVAINEGRYSQAVNHFDDAVKQWEMKGWYFRYARALREQKQFILAEQFYLAILNRYRHDRRAGLEYAGMLRTELRNYEKAETVLRRRVLDHHVNDREALLLLGDTYLDWAEEDPSKFEAARQVYATLLELYGTRDEFLARMMRYFIRTDQLVEVLPLKEHFTTGKGKNCLEAEDLIELSGYLLVKRYQPTARDPEYLRAQIHDLRRLLESALTADPESPEAHYNMGRFFIFNYMPDRAIRALTEALYRFETASYMTPKRVLRNVDTYRLLGNLRADEIEFLSAESLYSEGIALYQQHRANRTVQQDPLVGQLYASLADIHYFVSNDLAAAQTNYERSIAELNDTPSIRYRIGYIQYQNRDFEAAMSSMILAHAGVPEDRNLLFGLANALFRRGNYFTAQGYYERLVAMLEAERIRKGVLFPQFRTEHGEFVEMYMKTGNNLGVTLNRLAGRTGDPSRNSRAIALLAESTRAWDALTRNQETMIRATGTNLAYLNIQNITVSNPVFVPEIYSDIPKTLENERVLSQRIDR